MGISPERVTEFNPSLRDPVDVMGVPRTEADVAKWVPMPEFYRIRNDGSDQPCALLIEELSDAPLPMQNPMCRVVLDRFAGELELHPRLFIIATGNRTEDKSGANRMSTKLGNRMQTLQFDESLDDWCNWAIDADMRVPLISFIRFRPNLLSDFDANRKTNPTPRSWEMVNYVNHDMPKDMFYANVMGLVGEGAAAEYAGFLNIYKNLPSIDNIIMNPSKAEVPTDKAVMYALTGALANRVSEDNFDRLTEYSARLPQEFQVMYMLDAMKRQPNVKNTDAFVKWAVKNANVML